jgi:hypothetical protein
VAAPDDARSAWPVQPRQDRRRRWVTWPAALVVVWAALAVGVSFLILPTAADSQAPASRHPVSPHPGIGNSRRAGRRQHSGAGQRRHHGGSPAKHSAPPAPAIVALTPVSAGTYEEVVYNVAIDGIR